MQQKSFTFQKNINRCIFIYEKHYFPILTLFVGFNRFQYIAILRNNNFYFDFLFI
jgi:hypothetical protein